MRCVHLTDKHKHLPIPRLIERPELVYEASRRLSDNVDELTLCLVERDSVRESCLCIRMMESVRCVDCPVSRKELRLA